MTLGNLDDELAAMENSGKDSKNLRFRSEYADWIEQETKKEYGSLQKQARFMEKVIDFYIEYHGDVSSIRGDIRDIKDMLEDLQANGVAVTDAPAQDAPAVDDVETPQDNAGDDTSVNSHDDLTPAEKLEQMAHNGESIDPDEYDLSEANGARGIDRPAILIAAMRHESTQNEWTKDDIESLASREMGYSKSGANDRANEVIDHLNDSPLQTLEDEWLPDRIHKDISETNIMRESKFSNSPNVYEDELGKSIEAYTGARNLESEVYYADQEAMAQGMFDAFETLYNTIARPKNTDFKQRAEWAAQELIYEIEDNTELANTEIDDALTLSQAIDDKASGVDTEDEVEETEAIDPDTPLSEVEYDEDAVESWESPSGMFEGLQGFAAFCDERFPDYDRETVADAWESDPVEYDGDVSRDNMARELEERLE